MRSKIVATVRELAEPLASDCNLEVVDVEHHGSPRGCILRVTVDKAGGVTLDDCARFSRELGYLLEVKEVITHRYHLEVSSPGLERPLRTPRDFEKYVGRKVAIRTSILLRGRRNFKGVLVSFRDGIVSLDTGGDRWEISITTINQAKLIYEFPGKI